MNPLSLRATNYRTFSELELDLPVGCLAIVGENGAGKSSIVNVIDLALFGAEGRSLEGYLTDDGSSTELEIELTFEHAGETYRVRRGFSAKGRGKTTCDFERSIDAEIVGASGYFPQEWTPLTRESQKATQEAIEEVLGLSRETFRASAFLAQGDGAAFTEAQPRDRKRILADVLGLDVWERLRNAAGDDRRHAERLAGEQTGRIALLEESGGDVVELAATRKAIAHDVDAAEFAQHDAEKALTAAAETVQTLEQSEASYRVRESAVRTAEATLRERQAVVDRAAAAKLEAVEVQRELSEAGSPSARLAELEADLAALREKAAAEARAENDHALLVHTHREALLRRNDLLGRASALNEQAHALRVQAEHALAHVGEARCDVCDQVLGEQAAQATAKRLGEQAETFDYSATELDTEAAAIEIPDVGEAPETDPHLLAKVFETELEIATARKAEIALAGLQEKLRFLEKTIAEVTPELTAEVAQLFAQKVAAEEALAAIDEPEPGALEAAKVAAVTAKASLDIATHRLTELRTALIRAESALEAAQKVAAELEVGRARRDELQAELDLLSLLERAYGRDGIPALIVEASAIPSIETEASRILAELGTSYRVELRTQKALKSGDGLADTLDVVVIGDAGERAYESFSGGERSRIDVALRLALAGLLANRRGAESRVLVLDEVSFLDEAGQAALIDVLLGLRDRFDKIVVVSHHSGLRDAALDTVLSVTKDDGRSRVEVAA